ncbi:TPA: hypothetical protein ACJXXT_000181 [Pseudomonas aeruginosa]
MLTEVMQIEKHLKGLFNDFTAGEINQELSTSEIDFIIESYYQGSQKHINLRDGNESKRIVLVGIDEDYVYLSADVAFKCGKRDLFSFMQRSASKNKNSSITNAFRQSTKDGFESFLELEAVY